MPLKETREELYKPDSEIEKRKEEYDVEYDPEKAKLKGEEKFREEKGWAEIVGDMIKQKKKAIIVGAIFVFAVAVISFGVAAIVRFKQTAFSEDRVMVSIEGLSSVSGAQMVTYKIKYENNNRASLRNSEIHLNHSSNFRLESADVEFERQGDNNTILKLGEINSNSKGEVEFSGRFYAPKDFVVYLRPTLRFTPSNFNSPFEVGNQIGVNVVTAPISMNLVATGEILNNGEVEYVLSYKNVSDIEFKDIKIQMEYPEGFSYVSSEPRPSEGDYFWYVGNLAAGQEGEIRIKGAIAAGVGNVRVVKASLGIKSDGENFVLYNQKEDATRVVQSPLSIGISFSGMENSSVSLGDGISGYINFSNNGEKAYRGNIVTLTLDSPIIDLEKMEALGGNYDSETRTIVWKASDYPQLASLNPGDSKTISFSLNVKSDLDVQDEDDKNFSVDMLAKIESSDAMYAALGGANAYSEKINVKLNSKIDIQSDVYYTDSDIENHGPIPPKVGEETTYVVRWRIENWYNDLSNAVVKAYLPTGIRWKGKVYPDNENIVFNERTNEVVWNLGDLKNGEGVLGGKREVKFQIALVPTEAQINSSPRIIEETIFTGRDLFTGNNLEEAGLYRSTVVSDDDPIRKESSYSVVEN